MAGVFSFDLSGGTTHIQEFGNGPHEATIEEAKLDVSKAGNPMLVVDFKVYHPEIGEAIIRDFFVNDRRLVNKNIAFWTAITGQTKQEVAESPIKDVNSEELLGEALIVNLGDNEGKDGKIRKGIVPPWYWPATRTDVLDYVEAA